MGAVRFPEGIGDPLVLLETADEAMYQAKRQGKDRILAISSGPGGWKQRATGLEEKVCILVVHLS